jgi:reactive intermediate/imine deaminase
VSLGKQQPATVRLYTDDTNKEQEMKKIATDKAPAAIGPYSQGIGFEKLVFTSGQIPVDPATQEMVAGDFSAQARRSLENVKMVLEAGGASLDTVIKTTCFLADMNDFATFNEIYKEFFKAEVNPARSCVEVAKLPKAALVEVEAIAYVK